MNKLNKHRNHSLGILKKGKITLAAFLFLLLSCGFTSAQQLQISDFVLYSGNGGTGITIPSTPGYCTQMGSSITISGGSVGSKTLVQTIGNTTVNANINSDGKVVLSNSNVVTGKITAANSANLTGTILSVGSSALITGNIDVKGNIVISGGTVNGIVTHPAGTTYTGPVPSGGEVLTNPTFPTLPSLPLEIIFPTAGSANISNSQTINPGNYGSVSLSNNKTITFNGPGAYVFNSIYCSGSNNFVFDFQGNANGKFFIYVHGNADMGKSNATAVNGGNASGIYTEVHGNGSGSSIPTCSFIVANGSSSGISKWLGTVYATKAAINIGSGTGNSNLTGALWSATQVIVQSGVTTVYAPFINCTTPNASAGLDKLLTCAINSVQLNGSSSTSGVTYSWTAQNGGNITSAKNIASPTVNASGTYILTVTTASGGCSAKDTALVTLNNTAPTANAGADNILSLIHI